MAGKEVAVVILRHVWDGKSGELELWKARADKKLASTTFANNVHMISLLIHNWKTNPCLCKHSEV